MNKLLIVLLAVCLLSVHAFVKRDAPAEEPKTENYVNKIQQQLQDLTAQLNQKFTEAFDPDTLKKGFNDAVDGMNKALNELKTKASAGPKN